MDDGLIQFLVVAFFIIVSMMDGAARKRRKQAQDLGRLPTPDEFSEVADDLDEAVESSEEVVPTDLWQEIAALARGEVPGQGVGSAGDSAARGPAVRDPSSTRDPSATGDSDPDMEAWTVRDGGMQQMRTSATEDAGFGGRLFTESGERPEAPFSTATPSVDLQSGYIHPDQVASHQEHAHEEHAEVSPTTRPLMEERPHAFVLHASELSGKSRKNEREPRSLLSGVRSGAKKSLREAIVLAEVLSPPVVLRDSGWRPLF